MRSRAPEPVAASVHQRLLNRSRKRAENFNLLLVQYTIERLLYRLSQSPYADRFVLKGALLFWVWQAPSHRPTRDLDLLGFGSSSQDILVELFRQVCLTGVEPDGLVFDPASIQIWEIREDQEYGGQRVEILAQLGSARISVRIDIGFGDVVSPAVVETEYPTLLDSPSFLLRIYPKESVVAEKLHAVVTLEMTNSRMKDFFDLWTLSRLFAFDGRVLSPAIQSTFDCRHTAIPSAAPIALTPEFSEHPDKIKQWQGFLGRNRLDAGGADLSVVIDTLGAFLMPPLLAAGKGQALEAHWPAGGPWRQP